MAHRTLKVELGARSYPIHIGAGILRESHLYAPHVAAGRVLIVSNETVAPLYLETVLASMPQAQSILLPDGEAHKTPETLGRIYDCLLEGGFGRDTVLVALGGGVVGDITGFAAATYQRGISFIQAPTTLLAQVDASVGGKTGVNHPLGKNMIGAFHQPQAVIVDTTTLSTLPDRELRAGLAEVIKYGLLGDRPFFEWLEAHINDLAAREPAALVYAIERSCAIKARIVAEDEREGGRRALLNLGHTFGHAIEAGLGYGRWLHGEAVAAGMGMAADLSARLGWIDSDARERAARLIRRADLPVKPPPELTEADFMRLMGHDKKVKAGRIRLVLLRAIGEAVLTDDFDPKMLHATLKSYGSEA